MSPCVPARLALLALAFSLFAPPPGPARAATCPPVTFVPRSSYGTGSGPVEVTLADFTGDGIPDLAVTEEGGTISVLTGLASETVPLGQYGARVATSVGGTPYGIATADFDADGRPDVVVGNVGTHTVQVLHGLGSGTFASPLSFPAGNRPYEVLTGDFNEDGVMDIATANNGENSVRVLIGGNDGAGHWNGTFAPSVPYATTNLSLAITSGDFNEDGITDLVATESFSHSVALFLGNGSAGVGDGTFLPAVHVPDGAEPYDLTTGDFNEDGHLDLAVASSNGGSM